MPIADMRQVVAAIDDRPRHSGDGCTVRKQTPWLAAVASEMGHKRPQIGGITLRRSKDKSSMMTHGAAALRQSLPAYPAIFQPDASLT
jgi:hypothetical protein